MSNRIFILGTLVITTLLGFASYYIPENNDLNGVLASFFALSLIPLGTITIYAIKRIGKTETRLSILVKLLYSLLITFIFAIPIFFIEKNNPKDYEWYVQESAGYQESAGQYLLKVIVFIIYIFSLIIYFRKNFPGTKQSKKNKFRTLVFDSIFFISFAFSIIFLLILFSCDSDPVMFAFSILSVLGMILATFIDLIIRLIKKEKRWVKFQSIALLSWISYMFAIYYVVDFFDNNGKCEIFLGPDDSGLALTFLLITLHSYLIRKNESPTKNIVHLEDNAKNEDETFK
tara:strand:+ start:1020 stop:1883 length:864 start_codon:yes stop_codon:yes gene_type:complete